MIWKRLQCVLIAPGIGGAAQPSTLPPSLSVSLSLSLSLKLLLSLGPGPVHQGEEMALMEETLRSPVGTLQRNPENIVTAPIDLAGPGLGN